MSNTNPPTNGFDKRPQDINLEGAPEKPWTWGGLIKIKGDEVVEIKNKLGQIVGKKALKKVVVEVLWKLGAQGDMQAIKELGNRIDGIPPQSVDLTSLGEKIELPVVAIPTEKE